MTLVALGLASPVAAEVVTKRAGRLGIVVETDRAFPGGFFVVRFESRRRLGRLSALFEGRRARSFASSGGLRALVPIPLTTPPGNWTLGVELATRRGTQRMTLEVPVATRSYPELTRSLTPSLAELVRSPAAGMDGRRLMLIVRSESSESSWAGGFVPPVSALPDGFGDHLRHEPDLPVARYSDGAWGERRRSLDYRIPSGTSVVAPAGGWVVFAGELALPGATVVIDHGQGLVSALQHLSRLEVKQGERVIRGQSIGLSGATGLVAQSRLAWSLHLHGIAIDPRLAVEGLR